MLKDSDIKWLVSYGYMPYEIEKIKDAYRYVAYYYPTMDKKIKAEKARAILGDYTYLTGVAAAVLKKRCVRSKDGAHVVFVDKRFF